jgi:hypothetical protein
MTPGEREARLEQIEKTGVINKIESRIPKHPRGMLLKPIYIDWIAYGAILGTLVYIALHK